MQYKTGYGQNALEEKLKLLLEPNESLRQAEIEKQISLAFSRFGEFAYFGKGNEKTIDATKEELAAIYSNWGNHNAARNFEGGLLSLSNSLKAADESKIGGVGKSISKIPEFIAAGSLSMRLYCSSKLAPASKVIGEWAFSSSLFFDDEFKALTCDDISRFFEGGRGTVIAPSAVSGELSKMLALFSNSNSIKFSPVKDAAGLYESQSISLFSPLAKLKRYI